MRFVQWIMAACLFTASCDIVLVMNLGGQVRFSQLMLIFVCVAALARVLQDGRILWPHGGTALTLWLCTQFLFFPLSGDLSIGAQFLALLTLTIIGVFAFVQLYGAASTLRPLLRIYLLSYVAIALFGLVQFSMPILHLPPLLMTQWLVRDKIARINGFNYEPSFYATYLMMGWIMLVELRAANAEITRGRWWKWATIAVTVSLILSSSRTAWIFMIVECIARIVPVVRRKSTAAIQNATRGQVTMKVLKVRSALVLLAVIVAVIIGQYYLFQVIKPITLLQGTGIAGTATHSITNRAVVAQVSWEGFLEHPFLGRSLGGVPIYLAARQSIELKSIADLRCCWAFPVPLELLLASGVIGIIPLLVFIYQSVFGSFKLARQVGPTEESKWLRALARAMLFEWLLLMADQNVLRVYLWYHIGILLTVAYHLQFGKASRALNPIPVPETLLTANA